MASRQAIGVLTQEALDRLQVVFEHLAQVLQVPVPEIPRHDRDAAMLVARQLQAFATWGEHIDQAITRLLNVQESNMARKARR